VSEGKQTPHSQSGEHGGDEQQGRDDLARQTDAGDAHDDTPHDRSGHGAGLRESALPPVGGKSGARATWMVIPPGGDARHRSCHRQIIEKFV
jgi:hypothetical protein